MRLQESCRIFFCIYFQCCKDKGDNINMISSVKTDIVAIMPM